MFKVGVWLTENYSAAEGGGYSYYNKLIKEIDAYSFGSDLDIFFISTRNVAGLKKRTVKIKNISRISHFIARIVKKLPYTQLKFKLLHFAFRHQRQQLKQAGIQVLYYPLQAKLFIPDFPFIATNWDLGHLSTYPFPEITERGEFTDREFWYRQLLPQALFIFAESEAGKKELIQHLCITEKRVKIVPLFSGDLVVVPEQNQKDMLAALKIEAKNYFFYPAQFWAHKNHYTLVKAFSGLAASFPQLKLVFTGTDKGNLAYIKSLTSELHISDKVLFLGFVSNEELSTLYMNAIALVMPTFLGPTNMPLLEARSLNCAVACSDHEGHKEMLGDGALYFNPSDEKDVATQMRRLLDETVRLGLLQRAAAHRSTSVFNVKEAVKCINDHLLELAPIRNTWL